MAPCNPARSAASRRCSCSACAPTTCRARSPPTSRACPRSRASTSTATPSPARSRPGSRARRAPGARPLLQRLRRRHPRRARQSHPPCRARPLQQLALRPRPGPRAPRASVPQPLQQPPRRARAAVPPPLRRRRIRGQRPDAPARSSSSHRRRRAEAAGQAQRGGHPRRRRRRLRPRVRRRRGAAPRILQQGGPRRRRRHGRGRRRHGCREGREKKGRESPESKVVIGKAGEGNRMVFLDGPALAFDLEDLLRASAEVLGKGAFGTAYRAMLEDATTAVVKRLSKEVSTGRRDFEQQMELVGRIRHRNVVELRSYYYSKDEKLLVYDCYTSGSVSNMLHVLNLELRAS
ncbi:uncharacterized protein LOC100193135 isoform 2 [Zea mays]|nr:uncharacterized protein LOC100193135 isoform 2 [Zea mays]|eukprot:NP_001339397.1 uncharacterized protein LOC100193135 isoform 2 [Zea mays]